LLDIIFALLDAYLARRWAIWFYIKSTGFDVEFRLDVGLHQIFDVGASPQGWQKGFFKCGFNLV
jgi:hypothetical protein